MATPVEEFDFWAEVENRRNLFFLTVAGWLVAGPVLVFSIELLFPSLVEPAGIVALMAWVYVCYRVARRLTSMRCLRCGERAFPHPYFFMKDAKCAHCGYSRPGG